jgi:hypothetical protein
MDHAHVHHLTQSSLVCLHLMGFKEPCPTKFGLECQTFWDFPSPKNTTCLTMHTNILNFPQQEEMSKGGGQLPISH